MDRLTDTAIRAAIGKPRSDRVDLVDGAVPGLTLRIGKRRGATWSMIVRVVGEGGVTGRGHALKGPRRRVTLGTYPQVSLHAARAKANAYLEQARRGESPVEELERIATAGGLTVEALAEKFLTDYVYLKQLRATRRYEMAIRVHIVEGVGRVIADLLTRDQVRGLMKRAMVRNTERRGEVAVPWRHGGGAHVHRRPAKDDQLGIRERLLKRTDNPVAGMEDNLPKKRKRERVLSMDEARIVGRPREHSAIRSGLCIE